MKKLFAMIGPSLVLTTMTMTAQTAATPTPPTAQATTPVLRESPVTVAAKDWSLTIGAQGATPANDPGQSYTWGGEIGLAKTVPVGPITTDIGFRQGVGYGNSGFSDALKPKKLVDGNKDQWLLREELFWDWNFRVAGSFSVFAGPSISFVWGDTKPLFYAGPEAGMKLGLGDTAYLFTRFNYDLCVAGNAKDTIRATAGVGFMF